MCGRFSLATFEVQETLERFGIEKAPLLKPRYNIAPTQETAVILDISPKEISMLKWGLVPSWAKDEKIAYSTINARCEDIEKKPAYRDSFKNKRCLILADGFFEWKKQGDEKQPYRFTLNDNKVFAFAGLWAEKNGKRTFTIITTTANQTVKGIHDRMPVILKREDEKKWLNDGGKELLKPYDGKMDSYPVSKLVGSPTNDIEVVIKPHYIKK